MSNHVSIQKNIMQHISAQTGACFMKLVSILDFKFMASDRVNIDIVLQ